MNKLCITNREFKLILDDLRKETDIISEGSDFKFESCRRKHFYFIEFKEFENYPLFISKIHDKYGKNIHVETYHTKDNLISLNIRGLKKELELGREY